MALLDTLADLPIYVYPIVFVLLVIIVAVVALLVGKRKYNQDNGIVKEKKVKAPKEPKKPKEKTGRKLRRAEETAPASFTDEFDSDEDYDSAVESLKTAPAAKPAQKVVNGPVIVVDENKVNQEEVIEWKPPTEEKKAVAEPVKPAAEPVVAAAPAVTAPPAEPSENDWNDEDLELFEARAYSFDEETQSGYISDKPKEVKEEKPSDASAEPVYAFRERKESTRDPADDEGVQIFETKDEKPEPAVSKPTAKDEPKVNNSKYAYFDSVMEKEKTQETKWQPPQERSAPAPSESETTKKKSGMQYIELDLDDKE